MSKQKWKPGNMIYPLPAVMVSCGNREKQNIITIAWTGTVCTNPPMTYISLRPSRYSYDIIKENGYFVINLTTKHLVRATDFCGVKSGRDVDKFQQMHLTPTWSEQGCCPMIEESPVNIECKVKQILELGSHHMFLADVTNVYIEEKWLDKNGKFHLNDTELIAYSHGAYMELGKTIGTFGYSIRKKKPNRPFKNNKKKNKR